MSFLLTLECTDCGNEFDAPNRANKRCPNCKKAWWNSRRGPTAQVALKPKRRPIDPEDLCPNCGELLFESVAANGNGNDLRWWCDCGYERTDHSLYPHRDPESHRFNEPREPASAAPKPQEPEPVALCECGCGEPAPICTHTNRAKGVVKGQPVRFIQGHHLRGKPRMQYGKQAQEPVAAEEL